MSKPIFNLKSWVGRKGECMNARHSPLTLVTLGPVLSEVEGLDWGVEGLITFAESKNNVAINKDKEVKKE